jgi:hypothetical protein
MIPKGNRQPFFFRPGAACVTGFATNKPIRRAAGTNDFLNGIDVICLSTKAALSATAGIQVAVGNREIHSNLVDCSTNRKFKIYLEPKSNLRHHRRPKGRCKIRIVYLLTSPELVLPALIARLVRRDPTLPVAEYLRIVSSPEKCGTRTAASKPADFCAAVQLGAGSFLIFLFLRHSTRVAGHRRHPLFCRKVASRWPPHWHSP